MPAGALGVSVDSLIGTFEDAPEDADPALPADVALAGT
jgi:hypothetical protein